MDNQLDTNKNAKEEIEFRKRTIIFNTLPNYLSDYEVENYIHIRNIEIETYNIIHCSSFDKKFLYKIKYKPMMGSHYIVHINYNDLSETARTDLWKAVESNIEHIFYVIYVDDFRAHKKIYNTQRLSNYVSFVNNKYYTGQIKSYILDTVKKDITAKALNKFEKYINRSVSLVPVYLEVLNNASDNVITTSTINRLVKDYRQPKPIDLLTELINLNKKRKPYEILISLLENYQPDILRRELIKETDKLLSVKLLIQEGDLLESNVYDDLRNLRTHGKLPNNLSKCRYRDVIHYCKLCNVSYRKTIVLIKGLLQNTRDERSSITSLVLLLMQRNKAKDDDEYYKIIYDILTDTKI